MNEIKLYDNVEKKREELLRELEKLNNTSYNLQRKIEKLNNNEILLCIKNIKEYTINKFIKFKKPLIVLIKLNPENYDEDIFSVITVENPWFINYIESKSKYINSDTKELNIEELKKDVKERIKKEMLFIITSYIYISQITIIEELKEK